MREIQASMITDTIERLCIEANQVLPDDIKKSLIRYNKTKHKNKNTQHEGVQPTCVKYKHP